MAAPLTNFLSSEINQLTPEEQDQVLDFVRQLKSSTDRERRRQAILKTAGTIPPDDIERMRLAITCSKREE